MIPAPAAHATVVPTTITRSTMTRLAFQSAHFFIKEFTCSTQDSYVCVAEALDELIALYPLSKIVITSKRNHLARELANRKIPSDGSLYGVITATYIRDCHKTYSEKRNPNLKHCAFVSITFFSSMLVRWKVPLPQDFLGFLELTSTSHFHPGYIHI